MYSMYIQNWLCFSPSIGYPVVTLGFGFKSYVSYKMRLRKQKEVQKENEFYMQLLQQALPPEQQMLQRQEREAEEGEYKLYILWYLLPREYTTDWTGKHDSSNGQSKLSEQPWTGNKNDSFHCRVMES